MLYLSGAHGHSYPLLLQLISSHLTEEDKFNVPWLENYLCQLSAREFAVATTKSYRWKDPQWNHRIAVSMHGFETPQCELITNTLRAWTKALAQYEILPEIILEFCKDSENKYLDLHWKISEQVGGSVEDNDHDSNDSDCDSDSDSKVFSEVRALLTENGDINEERDEK